MQRERSRRLQQESEANTWQTGRQHQIKADEEKAGFATQNVSVTHRTHNSQQRIKSLSFSCSIVATQNKSRFH